MELVENVEWVLIIEGKRAKQSKAKPTKALLSGFYSDWWDGRWANEWLRGWICGGN